MSTICKRNEQKKTKWKEDELNPDNIVEFEKALERIMTIFLDLKMKPKVVRILLDTVSFSLKDTMKKCRRYFSSAILGAPLLQLLTQYNNNSIAQMIAEEKVKE